MRITSIETGLGTMLNQNDKNEYALANIFIIDDEPIVTEVIKHYLTQAGFKELFIFNNSVEAMETLSLVQVELIITDLEMPELGGKFLTKLARNITHLKTTPIIAISSDESIATRNHLMGNGVQAILYKPIDDKELVKLVKMSLEHQKEMKEQAAKSKKIDSDKERKLRVAFNRN